MSLGLRTHVIDLEQNINRIVRKVNAGGGIVVKVRASDFTQPLGRMSAKANEFTKSLEASNARVIAFGASAAIIGGVTLGFTQLVVQATKVEKILTDINVVLNTSTQNLEKFGNSLFKVARNTSQSLEVAAEAALEFSRQGLSMEETLKRTNDALILTRLTSLKAADSVKGLTAAVNGFADAGMTTAMVINKLSAVDIKFAVSTDDLINALSRAGAVAQDAGVSFDQLMGAVTSAQQITARGGAVIGNSFKTIFTRVQRGSTLQSLEDLGIAVRDIRGNTLPAMTVLQNLSSTYEKLGATTKAAVAEQVGGVFQINILKAAIKDLNTETSIYSQATKASSSATNEAYTKNAQLQKTLSSIANQTLTTVRELTANLGSLTIAPALQDFLSSANEVLGSFNKLFGDTEGESIGGDFAKGFARGLGSVLMGPGMMVAVLVFAKLFSQAFKFAKSSVKDLLQIQNIKEKEKAIQESIVDAMIKNVALSKELVKIDGDQVKQEQIVLALLKEQTAHIEQQRRIASDISPALRRAGVQPNLIVSKGSTSTHESDGFIPNYSNITPLERERERSGAQKGGYTAGAIAKMHVPKLGEVVYNKRESVRKFPGMQQPAIIPPISSKAGKKYQDNFSERHGFDPYGSSNNSTYNGGLIPNFALKRTKSGRNILKNWYDFDETLGSYPNSVTSADLYKAESAKLAQPTSLANSLKGRKIDILTARAAGSKPFIRQKLNDWGIKTGRIVTTGSLQNGQSSALKKAAFLQALQKKDGGRYNLIDDAPENIAAIKALKNKNLMAKLYTFSGQNAGRGSGNAGGFIPNFASNTTEKSAIRAILDTLKKRKVKVLPNDPKLSFAANRYMEATKDREYPGGSVNFGKHKISMNEITLALKKHGNYMGDEDFYGNKAGGLVPNFALGASQLAGTNILKLPKAKMATQTTKSDFRGNRVKGWKNLEAPLDSIQKSAASYADEFNVLKGLGVNVLQRKMFFTNKEDGGIRKSINTTDRKMAKSRGFQKNNRDNIAGSSYESGLYKNHLKDKGYNETWTGGYTPKGFQKGTGNPQSTVDFFKAGRLPIEAKYGKFTQANLIAKSIRLSSDRYIEDFLSSRGEGDIANNMANKKFQDASNTLSSLGHKNVDKSMVKKFGLSSGLVPNFMSIGSGPHMISKKSSRGKDWLTPSLNLTQQNWTRGQNLKGGSFSDWVNFIKTTRGIDIPEHYTKAPSRVSEIAKNPTILRNNPGKAAKAAQLGTYLKNFSNNNTKKIKMSKFGNFLEMALAKNFGKKPTSALYPMDFTHNPIHKLDGNPIVSRQTLGLNSQVGDAVVTSSGHEKNKFFSKILAHQIKSGTAVLGKRGKFPARVINTGGYNDLIGHSGKTKLDKTVANHTATGAQLTKKNGILGQYLNPKQSYKLNKYKKDFWSYDALGIKAGQAVSNSQGFIPNYLNTEEFGDTSTSAAQFNQNNGLDLQTALSGGKGFKLTKSNFQKVRQFLNSAEFRSLPAGIKTQLTNKLRIQSKFLKMGDVTRPYLKGKTSFPGRIAASGGLIPNFSNPLAEAIGREKAALSSQGSTAKVYVDQDQRLKDTLNPMGLMVANRRDEPISGAQGVNRAINQGLNPKTHGSSNNSTYDSGLIPNFNGSPSMSVPLVNPSLIDYVDGVKKLDKAAKGAAPKVKDHGKSSKEASGSGMDMMGAMFALTSVSYAVEGALGDVDSTAGALVKTLNAGIMGASQGVMVWQGLSSVGDSLIKKNTKMGKAMGVGTKILGGLGAAVGVLVPVFQAVKENTELLDSPMDTLAKAAGKASKGLEALNSAAENANGIKQTESQLLELNNSELKGSFQGRLKEIKLQTQLTKQQQALSGSASILQKELGLSATEVRLMTSGTAHGMMELQEAQLKYQQVLMHNTNAKNIVDSLNKGFFLDSKDDETKKVIGAVQTAASLNLGGPEEAKAAIDQLNTIIGGIKSTEASTHTPQVAMGGGGFTLGTTFQPVHSSQAASQIATKSMKEDKGGKQSASIFAKGLLKSLSNDPIEAKKLLEMVVAEMKKSLPFVEKSTEERIINYAYLRETTRLNRELANQTELSLNQDKINLSLGKEKQEVLKSARAHNIKYLAALGATTKAATLESEMLEKSKQIDQDLINKKTEINNKYKAEGIKYIDTLFNDKKNSLIDPILTQSQGGKDSEGKSLSANATWEKSQKLLDGRMDKFRNRRFFSKSHKKAGMMSSSSMADNAKAEKLQKDLGNAENQERVSLLVKQYLHSLKDSVKQNEVLNDLQKSGIIPEKRDLATFFSHSTNLKEQEIKTEEESAKVKKMNLDVVRAQLNMEKGTLSHAQKRLTDIKAIPYHQLDEVTKEQIDTNKALAQADYEILYNKEIYLSFGEGLVSLQSEQLEVERLRVKKESDSLNTQSKRLDAEEKLRKSTDDYKNIIRLKVENELKTLRNSTDDDITTLKQEKKQGAFGKRTEAGNGQLVRDEERAMLNHIEALKQGTYSLGALHSMAESTRAFEKALIEAKTKLENGGDFLEGQQGVILDTAHQKGGIEKLKGEKSVFNDRGATVRVAETDLKIAQAHKELNLTMGQGSLFADSMRVKIAEANVEMSRFGETMANTAFDATKEGFKGLIQDMGDGTKSLGEVAANFFGTIVDRMNEKLIDRAAGQLTAGLMEAAGFNQGGHVGFNQGGHVSRYSSGGTTRQVPAMLTSGEYVVQKRIVDRLGTNDLNKINDSGSLEELYDKPNNESFSLLNEGGIASPPIIKLKEGGVAKNYLSGIVGTINKFMGGIVKMAGGGILSSSPDDSAGMKMAKGAGYLAGSSLHAYQNRGEGNQGPSAPKAPTALNTHSSLNIDPTGNRMSAKYKANDSYRQDYGKYLLDKYQHDVDTNNQKVKSRASTAQGIVNGIGFMGIGMAASAAGDYAKAGGFTKEGRMAMRAEKDAAEYAANPQAYAPPAKGSERMPYRVTGNSFGTASSNPAGIGGGVTNNVSNSTQAGNNYNTGGMNFNSSRSIQSNLNKVNDYSWTKNNNLSSGLKNPYQLNQGGMIKMSSGGKVHNPGQTRRENFNPSETGMAGVTNNTYNSNKSIGNHHTMSTSGLEASNRAGMAGVTMSTSGLEASNRAGMAGVTNNTYNSNKSIGNHHTMGKTLNLSRSSQLNSSKTNDLSWTNNNNLSEKLKDSYQLNQGGMIKMSSGGKVHGPGGIDKVGPVMLDRGEFVIKSSSVNKIEKQSPGFFNRLNSMKMYEGGIVDPSAKAVASTTESGNTQNSSSNVTININVSSGGETSVSGGEAKQQAFASKIKEAVVGIISQEKRVGGMLSGN